MQNYYEKLQLEEVLLNLEIACMYSDFVIGT
jgi:hypothetical protein